MNLAQMRDFGALCGARFLDYFAFTTSTDGSEQTSAYIDRTGFESCKVVLAYETTLTAAETLTIAANLQNDDDGAGTNLADFGDAMTAAVVATGESGGSTENGVVELDFDLSTARRYIRVQFTPTLSASSSDVGAIMAIAIMGGATVTTASARSN